MPALLPRGVCRLISCTNRRLCVPVTGRPGSNGRWWNSFGGRRGSDAVPSERRVFPMSATHRHGRDFSKLAPRVPFWDPFKTVAGVSAAAVKATSTRCVRYSGIRRPLTLSPL